MVLTGGDPLKRPDIYKLIRHARETGLPVALTPSATPLATRDALQKAKDAGVRRLGISLDGADAETHDSFRRWQGSFERTLQMLLDGNGIMFVGHTGEIFPAGFLPIQCGRFPENSVVDAYQNHPTFVSLRDPDKFGGDCGICEYRYVCGGSRSRAYAVYGDPLAGEPDCTYEPGQVPLIQLSGT